MPIAISDYYSLPPYFLVSIAFENSFLVVSGKMDNATLLNTIYQFNPANDGWILREEKVSTPRAYFAGVLMEARSLNCFQTD